MSRRPRPELLPECRILAGLIDAALNAGQRGDGVRRNLWVQWTNTKFADTVKGAEAAVRTWRETTNPSRPKNIVPLLHAFYGEIPEYAGAKSAMRAAWRKAGGIADEDALLPARTIISKLFSEIADIVDLSVSQPTPDNTGGLIVPYTLRIHPDDDCNVNEKSIRIGVTAPYFMVESEHWMPARDTIFRAKKHPHTKSVGKPGAVQIIGPTDERGQIDGHPLGDEPELRFEPIHAGADGPIEFLVCVAEGAFRVQPTSDGADASATQTAVLDAIFRDAFRKDAKGRLVVASKIVLPGAKKVDA